MYMYRLERRIQARERVGDEAGVARVRSSDLQSAQIAVDGYIGASEGKHFECGWVPNHGVGEVCLWGAVV